MAVVHLNVLNVQRSSTTRQRARGQLQVATVYRYVINSTCARLTTFGAVHTHPSLAMNMKCTNIRIRSSTLHRCQPSLSHYHQRGHRHAQH